MCTRIWCSRRSTFSGTQAYSAHQFSDITPMSSGMGGAISDDYFVANFPESVNKFWRYINIWLNFEKRILLVYFSDLQCTYINWLHTENYRDKLKEMWHTYD